MNKKKIGQDNSTCNFMLKNLTFGGLVEIPITLKLAFRFTNNNFTLQSAGQNSFGQGSIFHNQYMAARLQNGNSKTTIVAH